MEEVINAQQQMFIGAECAAVNIDEGEDESRSQSSYKNIQYANEVSPGQFSRAVEDSNEQCMKDTTPEATG